MNANLNELGPSQLPSTSLFWEAGTHRSKDAAEEPKEHRPSDKARRCLNKKPEEEDDGSDRTPETHQVESMSECAYVSRQGTDV